MRNSTSFSLVSLPEQKKTLFSFLIFNSTFSFVAPHKIIIFWSKLNFKFLDSRMNFNRLYRNYRRIRKCCQIENFLCCFEIESSLPVAGLFIAVPCCILTYHDAVFLWAYMKERNDEEVKSGRRSPEGLYCGMRMQVEHVEIYLFSCMDKILKNRWLGIRAGRFEIIL